MLDLREIWEFRDLVAVLVLRDIKVRYKQSVFGVAWVLVRPLASMAVYTVLFGKLARIPSDGYPYALFVLAAILPWGYFSNAVSSSAGSLVASAGLIGKVSFPRLVVPLASVAGGLLDLGVSLVLLLAVMPFFGIAWTVNLAAIPLLVLAIVVTALGVGTLFSALTVAYRDFSSIAGYLLQFWLYVTPVVYPVSLIPENWRWVLRVNPMAGPIEGFRAALLGKSFVPGDLALSFAVSAALLVVGVAYFEKVERRFADII